MWGRTAGAGEGSARASERSARASRTFAKPAPHGAHLLPAQQVLLIVWRSAHAPARSEDDASMTSFPDRVMAELVLLELFFKKILKWFFFCSIIFTI